MTHFKDFIPSEPLSPYQEIRLKALQKKFSVTNKADLEKAYELLFDAYLTEKTVLVTHCLEIFLNIPFKQNFNTWTFVEPAYTLKYYLSTDEKEKATIQKYLLEEVRSPWYDDQEHQEYIQEIRNGKHINIDQEEYEKYKEGKSKWIFLRILLVSYLHLNALGAIGNISDQEVKRKIKEIITELKKQYK